MTPTPDIGNLLRQKQLMDSITSQGTQSALLQPGINQFDDTAGGSQGPSQPYTGLPTSLPARRPTAPAAPKTTPGMTYEEAQGPSGPKLLQRTPQGTSVPYGSMTQTAPQIQVGADGGFTVNPGGPPQVQAPQQQRIPSMPGYDPYGLM